MTSTPVMNSQMSPQVAWMNSTPNQPKVDIGDFKNFMDSSTNDMKAETRPQRDTADKIDTNSKVDTNDKAKVETDDSTKRADKPSRESKAEKGPDQKQVDEVTKAVEAVKELIKDELQITDDQLLLALETLGLTSLDLLNTDNVMDVVMEINGVESSIDLVTDEELYQTVTDLVSETEAVVKDLCETLDVDFEPFEDSLKQFEMTSIKTPVKTQNTEETEQNVSLEDKITFEEVAPETAKLHNFAMQTKNENTEEEFEETFSSKEDAKAFDPMREDAFKPVSFLEQLLDKVSKTLSEAAQEVSYTSVDVENVLNQITESIKIEVTNETSEINLRLHPENLGNVNVKVSANHEGVLTAHFTAQNESVKAIIENQAVVLKETLEAKGVTVEAVEVTIASHEFERNLNEENRDKESKAPSKKGVRRINLDAMEEETVSEEDTVVKDMMIQNGNTIDYTA